MWSVHITESMNRRSYHADIISLHVCRNKLKTWPGLYFSNIDIKNHMSNLPKAWCAIYWQVHGKYSDWGNVWIVWMQSTYIFEAISKLVNVPATMIWSAVYFYRYSITSFIWLILSGFILTVAVYKLWSGKAIWVTVSKNGCQRREK